MKLPSLLRYDVKQWKAAFMKGLWLLGEHAFFTTLALIFLAGLTAGLLFYQYVFFAPQNIESAAVSEFEFREQLFFNLLDGLEKEAAALEAADTVERRDIFNP